MAEPGRTPPRDVLSTLRREVGFCCPVEGCGSPYLTWHHFDPPWRYEKHHRPEGMIALCREHADKADNRSFTDNQLRHLKQVGAARATEVRGRFDWMRNDLLAHVGGNFYYGTPVILRLGSTKNIWFERDENNDVLLNIKMPTLSGEPRARIENNVWTVLPRLAAEVICPPNGRLIDVKYNNGDWFRVEYQIMATEGDFFKNYPGTPVSHLEEVVFPLTRQRIRHHSRLTDSADAHLHGAAGCIHDRRMDCRQWCDLFLWHPARSRGEAFCAL
jgi:hypothetical protein